MYYTTANARQAKILFLTEEAEINKLSQAEITK